MSRAPDLGLPWRCPATRPARPVSLLVVHHTAGHPTDTPEALHRYHTAPPPTGRGWSAIGYHVVVHEGADGVWRASCGRDPAYPGAHAAPTNAESIGVAVCGNYVEEPLPDAAESVLAEVLAGFCRLLELPATAILGHREVPGATVTACPGFQPERIRLLVEAQLAESCA